MRRRERNNLAAFALAGIGANVTSTDISERRVEVASNRAARLALPITFAQAEAADLAPAGDAKFDLVCSTNGFFVWIADLSAVFGEVSRILRPGGHYVFYDIHPFQRPWKDQPRPIEAEKSYWKTGPFEDRAERTFEFHWTLGDILNPLAASGLIIRQILESPARDSRYWQDSSYMPGTDDSLLDWNENPERHCRYGSRRPRRSRRSARGDTHACGDRRRVDGAGLRVRPAVVGQVEDALRLPFAGRGVERDDRQEASIGRVDAALLVRAQERHAQRAG